MTHAGSGTKCRGLTAEAVTPDQHGCGTNSGLRDLGEKAADGGREDARGVAFVDPAGPDLATVSEDAISGITDTVSDQTARWRDRAWNGLGPEG